MHKGYISEYRTIIKASVEKVWEALTQPEYVKQYLFGAEMITNWTVGCPISWKGEFDGRAYEDKGVVLEFVTNKRLSYSYLSAWAGLEDLPENYLVVNCKVVVQGTYTELVITQSNYEQEKIEHSIKNWEMAIGAMKKVIEN